MMKGKQCCWKGEKELESLGEGKVRWWMGGFGGNKVIESTGSCFLPSPLATYTGTFRCKDKQSSGYLIHWWGGGGYYFIFYNFKTWFLSLVYHTKFRAGTMYVWLKFQELAEKDELCLSSFGILFWQRFLPFFNSQV